MNIRLEKEFAVNHTGLRRFLPRHAGVKLNGFTRLQSAALLLAVAWNIVFRTDVVFFIFRPFVDKLFYIIKFVHNILPSLDISQYGVNSSIISEVNFADAPTLSTGWEITSVKSVPEIMLSSTI